MPNVHHFEITTHNLQLCLQKFVSQLGFRVFAHKTDSTRNTPVAFALHINRIVIVLQDIHQFNTNGQPHTLPATDWVSNLVLLVSPDEFRKASVKAYNCNNSNNATWQGVGHGWSSCVVSSTTSRHSKTLNCLTMASPFPCVYHTLLEGDCDCSSLTDPACTSKEGLFYHTCLPEFTTCGSLASKPHGQSCSICCEYIVQDEVKQPLLDYIDHVTFACNALTSSHLVKWYSDYLGFTEVPFVNTKDGKGFILEGDNGLYLSAIQWMCSEVVVEADSSSSNGSPLRIVFAEPLPKAGPNQVQKFLIDNGGPGVQHIAFHTHNITLSVSLLMKNGLSFITPPPEYYSLMKQCTGVTQTGQDIESLERSNVLIDVELTRGIDQMSQPTQSVMVHTCIVVGCNNRSSEPSCINLSWHRLSQKLHQIKGVLLLPDKILECKDINQLKHHRICDECLTKAFPSKPVKSTRKPPTRPYPSMASACTNTRPQRFTRDELRKAILHDHNYCLSSAQQTNEKIYSTHLRSKLFGQSSDAMLMPLKTMTVRPHSSSFCIEMFANNNDAISFYTSFPTYTHLVACFDYLGDAVNHLNYPYSHSTQASSSNSREKVHRRSLTPMNEFFLTLCRLRCGLLEQDLAFRFNVSQPSVSRIVIAWINLLYHKLQEIPIWPSRDQVDNFMPSQFKELYPNTRIIIDCTEVFIQKPTDPLAQQVTFSNYKNHNTAKVLAGITPSGAFSFISSLYGGSISDREIFIQSGLLEKLAVGDAVMADKGFNIADLLESRGITLNIPPRKCADQFNEMELIETRRIASLRIHIERAFGRVKSFKILSNIPNTMAGLSSEIFYTCALLTNFQPPLVLDKP